MDGTFSENDISRVVEADRAHIWHHLSQHKAYETTDPRIIVEGKGMRVWDQKGKEHLDAVSGGVWTVNVGYGRESIANAVRDQLIKLNYFAGSAGSIPGSHFAEKLIDKMPGMSRLYYCNSGSEANEKAFKMIRQIAHKRYGGKKHKILYRDRDYHGTTIACLSAGGQEERNAQYGPFTDGFVRVPHCLEYRKFEQDGAPEDNYGVWAADQIEKIILAEGPDTVGGLCLEPVTAGGGVITPPDGYWERVQEICRKYDVLLHIDEVVCGIGRTGEWFGYQHFGIQPDMVTMAKGVASGYAAIACLVTTEEVFNLFKDDASDPLNYFRDISTFGGCTAGPTAAIENMAIIERENLLQNTRDMGQYMLEELEELSDKYDVIGQVRGKGLFLGAELVQDRSTRVPVVEAQIQAVVADCMAQGVIIGATNRSVPGKNNTLCFSPALIAKKDDIDQIIAAVDGAMGRVFGSK
ncbi:MULTISPECIES: aspartate aminotransferase family protein [Sulfitobacter]|jgi:taurine-pyruvate aminotransferase|uniref:Taurine--pyruvate aminotransferase n=1 Tax=Sulfitobacter pontiacus TaxID=60137 RepID=A0AAX3A9U8_9RHOB|nr:MULTISPECIES: aminotransferase class III-fold pyridoxal phosphate-dependent enzyme [Sulfitobacter]MAX75456.1 aspartate aminotransferase family protein [Roseobacter sp.]HBU54344.1 aspartate aminotransferase family protein [Sulfitobacter sp.]PTA97886.1 aspartate aminotransferase family protein [Sulfitobacter sp. CB-A]ULO20001.1 aminotransferase class III-fold pyridoxal phosphate-dependent enzyme [Sulfitobacter sp. CB2047]UOA22216.1 Taurine--pyruvate aminotransferase [Sulfitobacter pontiacus]|tara:strand:- start:2247 stop:3644 length:1398 start_codon:yes stop_codon:yes gene_type:complete